MKTQDEQLLLPGIQLDGDCQHDNQERREKKVVSFKRIQAERLLEKESALIKKHLQKYELLEN